MVNTQLLEKRIAASGKKKKYLADKANISVLTLRNKMQNLYPFNSDEIEALCSELAITKLTEKEAIFFASKVDI